jgi:hypothetical protein
MKQKFFLLTLQNAPLGKLSKRVKTAWAEAWSRISLKWLQTVNNCE